MIGLSKLQREVENVIQFSQAYPFDLNCEPLINQWLEAKKPFIDMFDGLIYQSPTKVSITLSEERQKSFAQFINSLTENGIFAKSQPLGKLSFLDFLYDNKEGFLLNRITKDYPEFHINKNQKLMKAIKKFFDDEPTARWVQDTASTYIQGNKIEGYLYFSVHPLDYLLMSETNLGWKSCHSLDGDYRHGNLNYMVDHSTIVVYLADEKKAHLRCLPEGMEWYNKKWRMLVHTNLDTVIYYAKGYPFMSKELINIVYQQFKSWRKPRGQTFREPMDIGFNRTVSCLGETHILGESYIDYVAKIRPTSDYVNYDDYNGFKDLTESFTYAPICSIISKVLYDWEEDDDCNKDFRHRLLDIKIGEAARCPVCGKLADYYPNKDFLLCSDCQDKYGLEEQTYLQCTSCGKRIYDDEPAYKFDDTHDIYCKKCYNSLDKGEREHGKTWRRSKRKRNGDN